MKSDDHGENCEGDGKPITAKYFLMNLLFAPGRSFKENQGAQWSNMGNQKQDRIDMTKAEKAEEDMGSQRTSEY